jgi:hypothetical protein
MNTQGTIKYILAIIVILSIAFLSQKAYAWKNGKDVISTITEQATAYLTKGSNWAMDTIYPKVTGAVQKRGEMIKTEVKTEKQNVSENIGKKISNYFSEVGNSILHPGTPQNCQPVKSTN